MAIPVPRSFNQILSDQLDAFLSRTGLSKIRPGSPILSILMAGSQSDLRSSKDIFDLLNSTSLDRAIGQALDRIGADEDAPRLTQSPASGFITITNNSVSKIASKIYQGKAAPIVGTIHIYVANALGWAGTGSIYIGRGTSNYEGPLVYTGIVPGTGYYDITLASGTLKFHNLNESVIVSNGGDKTIAANTIVQTAQSNLATSIQFSTTFSTTIPDGEVEISGVQVIASNAGVSGNVTANSIVSFATPPFSGVVASNPLPFTNGIATENDDTYRERIKSVKQSRVKGTALAVQTAALGLTATDENKRVTSASLVTRQGYPTTLYIDDGTGYEEISEGVAVEPLVDLAVGGEQYTQIAAMRPVAKAFVTCTTVSPFIMVAGSIFAVKVGGIPYEHTFQLDDFRNVGNATAYEIVASINGNSLLQFSARTSASGTKVVIFAKDEVNEDLQVTTPSTGVDANEVLLFPMEKTDTMRLYKSDRLLSKDGIVATLSSNSMSLWTAPANNDNLILNVDSTGAVSYVFVNADFINVGTGYVTVGLNSLAAWANVLNCRIPGITATVSGGLLVLTSNVGTDVRSSLEITGGTLVAKKMFEVGLSTGLPSDYTLDRNTGQIRLETALVAGERLSAGSVNTRGFVQSTVLSATTIAAPDGNLWFTFDSAAEIVPHGLNGSVAITVTSYTPANPAWGERNHFACASAVFLNVQSGDWVIIWDSCFAGVPATAGIYRVSSVAVTGLWFEIDSTSDLSQGPVNLVVNGIAFVRATGTIQNIAIANGANQTASHFATSINASVVGGRASTYLTNSLRVTTDTFGSNGDVALVAMDTKGSQLGISTGDKISSNDSQLSFIESGIRGTPSTFQLWYCSDDIIPSGGADTSHPYLHAWTSTSRTIRSQDELVCLTNWYDSDGAGSPYHVAGGGFDGTWAESKRSGNNSYFRSFLTVGDLTAGPLVYREPILRNPTGSNEWIPYDRLYMTAPYSIAANDELVAVVDGDMVSKRFTVPLSRQVKPSGAYGATITLMETDTKALGVAFGSAFDFDDYAVLMPARTITHSGTPAKEILWRYMRVGPDGNMARLRYVFSAVPDSATTTIAVNNTTDSLTYLNVTLPSGTAKTNLTFYADTKVGVNNLSVGAGAYKFLYVFGLPVVSATRKVRIEFTPNVPTIGDGDAITGVTSAATGTVDYISGKTYEFTAGPVLGPFILGETVTGLPGGGSAVVSRIDYGYVTLTLGLPAAPWNLAAAHNIPIGASIYLKGSGSFPTSQITVIDNPAATQITYEDTSTTQVTEANIGTVTYGTDEVTLTGALPSPIIVGDLFRLATSCQFPNLTTWTSQTMQIEALGPQYIAGYMEHDGVTFVTPGSLTWYTLTDPAAPVFFPIGAANKASDVVSSINNITTSPVKAFALGDGTGLIDKSSLGSGPAPDNYSLLVDGINFVRITNKFAAPANYTFDLKNAVDGTLATGCDWTNEEVYLAPITPESVVGWMNSFAVTGLSSSCEIRTSSQNQSIQIASTTPGTEGSIQVQGGSANSTTATVVGSSTIATLTPYIQMISVIDTSSSLGFIGDSWVKISNANLNLKVGVFDAASKVSSINVSGLITMDGAGTPLISIPLALTSNRLWKIEKQGQFVCYSIGDRDAAVPNLISVAEGDWLIITTGATIAGNYAVSSANTGHYRVVRVQNDTNSVAVWVENENAIEEEAQLDIEVWSANSMMVGDTLQINTPIFGVSNMGSWTVTAVAAFAFNVSIASRVPVSYVTPVVLGANAPLVTVADHHLLTCYKHLISITPSGDNTELKFDSSQMSGWINEGSGSVITALDKLDFPITLAQGVDGYSHSVGLIGETTRVLYGDFANPASYPGVVAAGSNVNVSGPIVKRITASFSLRVRSGVSTIDIANRVRSAVASVINSSGVGQQISISSLVAAASKVSGVVAVAVVSPIFSSATDLITVQAYEKPQVLDLEQDISVSFVGV